MNLQIGTVRNIPIRLHVTLVFVFLLLSLQFGFWGIPAGILLFGSVLLHELGHAIVAQERGFPIARIDLHLLGGTAMMSRPPETPRDEIWVAAAGPVVSFALAFGLGALSALFGGTLSMSIASLGDLLAYGSAVNLGLGLFNLIPALPMDGGRIFRAALSAKFGNLRGTEIAARVSRVFGALFILGALLSGSLSLGLIGLVLFVLVGQEERMARLKAEQAKYATGPRLYVPFGPLSDRFGAGGASGASRPDVVLDVGDQVDMVEDRWGRRWPVRRRP